jgi:hypothetical protein
MGLSKGGFSGELLDFLGDHGLVFSFLISYSLLRSIDFSCSRCLSCWVLSASLFDFSRESDPSYGIRMGFATTDFYIKIVCVDPCVVVSPSVHFFVSATMLRSG